MKRTVGVLFLLAAGCVSTNTGAYTGGGPSGVAFSSSAGPASGASGSTCGTRIPPTIPGVQGPWGQPVTMQEPYANTPPRTVASAHDLLSQSIPLDQVQLTSFRSPSGDASGIVQAGGLPGMAAPPMGLSPPGIPPMPPMPGLGPPPVPGAAPLSMGAPRPPGVVAAIGALVGHGGGPFPPHRTEIFFTGPLSMRVSWYAPTPEGKAAFSSEYIEAPGRYNFPQAAIYRLKLADIPNRAGVELYPTLEVVPANHKTEAFLAHAAVPITFTEDDFDQVLSGNYVVKVIYLPDPAFQDLATTGPDEVVSTRLEPGIDPVAEACRRGSILAIVRLGNIQLELSNSPAMDAPSPYQMKPMPPVPGPMPGVPNMMPPVNGMPPGMPMVPPGMPMMPPGMPMMPPAVQTGPGQGGLSRRGPSPGQPGSKLPDVPSVQAVQYQPSAGDPGNAAPADLTGQKSSVPKPW
jgi:hypothetical protein